MKTVKQLDNASYRSSDPMTNTLPKPAIAADYIKHLFVSGKSPEAKAIRIALEAKLPSKVLKYLHPQYLRNIKLIAIQSACRR